MFRGMVIDMRDKSIGRTLRYYRKAAQLSIADVIEIFQTEYDIHYTNKAIYGWESGHTQPSADTFLTLCKIYDIHNIIESMNYACKSDKGPLILTENEERIILQYRENKKLRPAINKLFDIEDE